MPQVESSLLLLSKNTAVRTLSLALAPAQLFFVGGAVRDSFYSEVLATDIDVATDLNTTEIITRARVAGLHVVETGVQHGTVLIVQDQTHIEITTFRIPSDRNEQNNANDITTDLSGRDFTINAIAFDIHTGKILDPFNGIADLNSNTLRAINEPQERFREDPLRILRMIRFGPAQKRSVDSKTSLAAQENVSLLAKVTVERIKAELEKILICEDPAAAIKMIHEIDALHYTIPELLPSVDFEQNEFHTEDVFNHILTVISRTPPDAVLRWTALFHDIGKPHTLSTDEKGRRHFYLHEIVGAEQADARMLAMKFSNSQRETIRLLVREHMRPLDCGAPGVRRLMRDLGPHLDRWEQFKLADKSPITSDSEVTALYNKYRELRELEEKKSTLPIYGKLAVNGDDLQSIGIPAGREMGRVLALLRELVLDDPTRNEKPVLLEEGARIFASLTKPEEPV